MNVKTEQSGAISIVRVGETRMMYPMLAEFSGAVSALIAGGARRILIDLGPVTYVDSATIGCFMSTMRSSDWLEISLPQFGQCGTPMLANRRRR